MAAIALPRGVRSAIPKLDVQEFYADVYAGTRNVRDLFDPMDERPRRGLLGVGLYLVLHYQLRDLMRARRAARPRHRRH